MPKTVVFRDNSHLDNLVLGNVNYYTTPGDEQKTAPQKEPQPEREIIDVDFEEVCIRFSYITPQCVKKNMVEHVEAHLRAACPGQAKALWECIHSYELMGYLSTANEDTSKIYYAMRDYFKNLKMTLRNFSKYR